MIWAYFKNKQDTIPKKVLNIKLKERPWEKIEALWKDTFRWRGWVARKYT